MAQQEKWTESDTDLFLQYGKIFAPERNEWAKAFAELIPADKEELFTAVDLGTGGGWLAETLLSHYPNAKVIAMDGSEGMLKHTKERLEQYESRLELRQFDLYEDSWLLELQVDVKCFVSSLVIHHLELNGKQQLFHNLYRKLNAGGAVLIADVVKPASEMSRSWMGKHWAETTKKQSFDYDGSLNAYDYFTKEKWNLFDYPDDPIDKPSTLLEQLKALEGAGFSGVDVFWAKSGHAMFGGYKK